MGKLWTLAVLSLVITDLLTSPGMGQEESAKGRSQAIAEEAIIYGFPMVMNYGVIYATFIDKSSSQYKCPLNQLYNTSTIGSLAWGCPSAAELTRE
jgi:hypothetical protein